MARVKRGPMVVLVGGHGGPKRRARWEEVREEARPAESPWRGHSSVWDEWPGRAFPRATLCQRESVAASA